MPAHVPDFKAAGCPGGPFVQSSFSSLLAHLMRIRWWCRSDRLEPARVLNNFDVVRTELRVRAYQAPNSAAVVGIGGHGVAVRGVTVKMSHSLSFSASIFQTHGTAFEISGCDATHDNANCKPGYPGDCLLFFASGTDGGLVANNTFHMGCCAFCGYAASGVLLEDNHFTDLMRGVYVDGNGFTSFGNKHVAERISFSRNLYQGLLHNSSETRMANEAFTSDGTGAAYYGHIVSSSGKHLAVNASAAAGWIGAAVAILEGHGQGQVRRVVAVQGQTSRRRDCHSATPPSPFSRRFNRDGEGLPAQSQPRRRLTHGGGRRTGLGLSARWLIRGRTRSPGKVCRDVDD